jgi:hypothetical protein
MLFTATLTLNGNPGSTTPLVGVTVIHVALPPLAVKGTGPPVVVKINVCAAGGFTGVLKLSVVPLSTSVGGGASTVSVTGMLNILGKPTAEN